jgi:hypothetical protein
MSIDPAETDPATDAPTPLAVRLWFGWAFALPASPAGSTTTPPRPRTPPRALINR